MEEKLTSNLSCSPARTSMIFSPIKKDSVVEEGAGVDNSKRGHFAGETDHASWLGPAGGGRDTRGGIMSWSVVSVSQLSLVLVV